MLVFVYVRPISARPAVIADKTILCTSLNHFISKVVHDKFPFLCDVVANGPRLRIQILSAKFGSLSPVLYRT